MKIQLKEEQIKKLMKGYKLLSEQSQSTGFDPTVKTESINFNAVWEAGKYKLTPTQITRMKSELDKVVTFLKANPTAKLNIEIEAGESRVTNFDREKCGTSDFKPECKLDPGVLSNNRAKALYDFLLKYFKQLKDNNVIATLPNKPTTKTVIGTTPYTQGKDKPSDPKYIKEQYVKLNISASATYDCLIGLDIKVAYDRGSGHVCDEAIFALKVNGVTLGVANLNNGTLDVNGSNTKLTPDLEKIFRKHNLSVINTETIEIAREIYLPLRTKPIEQWVINYEPLKMKGKADDFGIANATLNDVRKAVNTQYIKVMDFKGKMVYNPETVITKKMIGDNRYLQPLESFIGMKMGTLVERSKFVESIRNVEGRESDKQSGGYRAQTFKLDTERAKEIVNKASIKNRLIFTLVPLVDKTGPYSVFYKRGSHTEVPRVTITGKEGEVRYNEQPNVESLRGSTEETLLTQTDLCGNKIVE